MRRADAILLFAAIVFGGFIAYTVVHAPARERAPALEVRTVAGSLRPAGANEVVVANSGLPAPVRDINAIRAQLQAHQAGTFIDDILSARDSNIARWPDRLDRSVTVWIDEHSPLAGPQQQLPTQVRQAFADWGMAGVPLRFTFVGDSARAEVHVTFLDHFDGPMSGLTTWTRDPNWWILGGDIKLSLRSGNGRLLDNDQIYVIALHEVGHLLGLDHASDTLAVMAPRVRVLQLSPLDIATMRLIYELPPGTVKKR